VEETRLSGPSGALPAVAAGWDLLAAALLDPMRTAPTASRTAPIAPEEPSREKNETTTKISPATAKRMPTPKRAVPRLLVIGLLQGWNLVLERPGETRIVDTSPLCATGKETILADISLARFALAD
jgi:hypothetical protein